MRTNKEEIIRLVLEYYSNIEQYRIAFIDNGEDYYSITDTMVYKDEYGEIKFIFDQGESFVMSYYGDSYEQLKDKSINIHHITHDIPDGVKIKSHIISDIMSSMRTPHTIFKNKLPKPNDEPYFVIYRKIEKNKIKYEIGIYTRVRNTDEDRVEKPYYWDGLNDMYEPIFDKDVLYWKKLK